MQNKGAIKVFAIAFALACFYQLSFTLFTKNVEKKARNYAYSEVTYGEAKLQANGDKLREKFLVDSIATAKESFYLDSMSSEVVYNFLWIKKFTYQECKNREINLGLDLKGGMNVMMEVSTADVVRALAGNTTDPTFNKAMDLALEKQKTRSTSFVTLFGEAIKEVDPNVQLAGYFSNQLREKIKLTDDNEKVLSVIREEASSAFERTYQVLRQRIDKFGVAQPNIQKLDASERILVELPGVKDPDRVRGLLQGTAELGFWLCADNREAYPVLERANAFLADVESLTKKDSAGTVVDTTVAVAKADTAKSDLLASLEKDTTKKSSNTELAQKEMEAKNPLFSKLMPNVDQNSGTLREGPVVGHAPARYRKDIDEMLALAQAKKIIPSNIKFLWDAKPIKGSDFYSLYAISITSRDGSPLLSGDVISDARQDFDQAGGNQISMNMNPEGEREWKKITGANIGNCVAIVLDNYVYSAPVIRSEISGTSSITGDFTIEEAKDVANVLKAGKLPAPARIVQEAVVGPSLGQESINAGFMSFIVAFIIVIIYMIFFYSTAGAISAIALFTNVFFLMGVLASLQAVLTLPGIAGIVLTMAMAVDANVIINERIKEELRAGKTLAAAVTDGYKHAYSAIIDGNVTTLLTGIVLVVLGSGPVQGFAVTLCVGILTSLFTSIFITRLVIGFMLSRKKDVQFSFAFNKNFLTNTHIDFVGMRKKAYVFTIVLFVLAVGALVAKGLNYGIDFQGGRSYTVYFDKEVSVENLRSSLAKQFDGAAPEVKTFGTNDKVKVTTKYKITEDTPEVKKEVETKLYNGCKDFYAKPLTEKEFLSTQTNPLGIIAADIVGPTIANDIKRSALIAVFVALALIFVYIVLRFRKYQYGTGAVVSLTNDAMVTIGVFAFFNGILPFNMEVDQSFVAAILTVIGYSINDTVIIFDRVREYTHLYPRKDFKDVVNAAVNSTLGRTVNTTGSTVVVLLIIFIFGGEVIRGFSFALLFGVVIGTYSSVFIAVPIMYDLIMRKKRKELEAK